MALQLGDLELTSISGGRMRLDGGNMFGVVPKVMWEKKAPADERNRILLDTNCLLVRSPRGTVLIETGCGTKASPKEREIFALEEGDVLLDNLARQGVRPEDIDVVILTHLHFDHAGGATRRDASEELRPTFPKARYIVQRPEWEDAAGDLPELAGAYFKADFMPLEKAGQLELVEGEHEVLPGIAVRPTGGHTRGHQVVELGGDEAGAVYLGDICPTSAHLPTFWTMAYDQFPLDVRRVKPQVLSRAHANHWLVLFDHDPEIKACYLERDEKEAFYVAEVVGVEGETD